MLFLDVSETPYKAPNRMQPCAKNYVCVDMPKLSTGDEGVLACTGTASVLLGARDTRSTKVALFPKASSSDVGRRAGEPPRVDYETDKTSSWRTK